jgi:hypothetical protein
MRTYLAATAAITGFYPGLVLAQSVNPSGMTMPNFQVEALMAVHDAGGQTQVFLIPHKPAAHIIAADTQTMKPVITPDNAPVSEK